MDVYGEVQKERKCHYMAIDLKSFYASCECRERDKLPKVEALRRTASCGKVLL